MTLADLLFAPAYGIPPDEAVVHAGAVTTTHAELVERARRLGDAIRDAGVQPGMPVAVMLGNDAGAVAALFGVWAAGAVHLPLSPRLAAEELDRLLARVPPAAAVTTSEHAPRFAAPTVVMGADARGAPVPDAQVDRASEVPRHDADVALVQMTSGTTGPPKPVELTHSRVLAMLDGVLRKVRGADARERSSTANLVPVSLSLWAGIYNVCFAFRVGAPVVLMDRFEPRLFADLVRRHAVRSVVLPPAAMAMLCDDPAVTSLEPLEWVRAITAPLSPSLARRFHERFGTGILNSYGQTELGGEVVGWNARDWREWATRKLGAVGRPHDGVEVREVDGELQVRTPALAGPVAGDLVDRLTPDGWLCTGDTGRVDGDGFVWVDGRVSELINRGGMKITPAEVEAVIEAVPGVREAAVVGVPDDRLGEVPVAFVVPDRATASAPPEPAALAARCREHLAPWKVPVRFEAIATLPRNEVGKVQRRELAQRPPTRAGGGADA